MCRAVLRRHLTVLGFQQHLAVLVDQNGAEGMVALDHLGFGPLLASSGAEGAAKVER
jgi:hypothetical protein